MTDKVYRLRTKDIEWHDIEDGRVATVTGTQAQLTLNASAVVLLPWLQESATIPVLTTVLVETYGLDATTAEADVVAFLDSLIQSGFLETPGAQ